MRCQIKILGEKSNRSVKKWHQEDRIKLCEVGTPCSYSEHTPKQNRKAGTPGIEQTDVSQRPDHDITWLAACILQESCSGTNDSFTLQSPVSVSKFMFAMDTLMCISSWLWVWQFIIFQNFILREKTSVCVCSVMSNSSWTLWTVVCQAPLSMEFSRQEYWSELPFPMSDHLPDPGNKPGSLITCIGRWVSLSVYQLVARRRLLVASLTQWTWIWANSKIVGQRSLACWSPWGHKESDMT